MNAARLEWRVAPQMETVQNAEIGVSQWLGSIDSRIQSLEWNDEVALALVPLDILDIEPMYQRSAETQQGAKNIAVIQQMFDPVRFGALAINVRKDLSLWVVDGQHRVIAMRKAGRGSETFPALVSFGSSLGDEARRFRTQDDNSKPLSLVEKFNARLADPKDIEAQRINEILNHFEYHVAQNKTPGALRSIATIVTIVSRDGEEALGDVLDVVRESWGDAVGHVDNTLLRGLARFLVQYGHVLNRAQLIRSLKRASPLQVRESATSLKTGLGEDKVTATVNAIVRIYNRGWKGDHLPSFQKRQPLPEEWVARQERSR